MSRARRARGISLEDAERDTHVSRRYLQALETEDFSIFPAPVYARGFLRTYSRYLGLNPDELIRVFPNGSLTVDITPLPTVTRPPAQLINVNWLVAGLVTLFLLGAGLLLLGSRDDAPVVTTSDQTQPSTPLANGGQPPSQPASSTTGPIQGRAITIRPGLLPDFVGADLASTLAVLRDNQMSYVIIEVQNRNTPKGLVMSQTPPAGAKASGDAAVTLVVSAGVPQ